MRPLKIKNQTRTSTDMVVPSSVAKSPLLFSARWRGELHSMRPASNKHGIPKSRTIPEDLVYRIETLNKTSFL